MRFARLALLVLVCLSCFAQTPLTTRPERTDYIFNADGNEKVSLTNRGPQHGPIGGMGTRANAQELNINRDNTKLETPEARSMVRLLNDYDPYIMVDLHTTNGSFHA